MIHFSFRHARDTGEDTNRSRRVPTEGIYAPGAWLRPPMRGLGKSRRTSRAVTVGLCAAAFAAALTAAPAQAHEAEGAHWALKDSGSDVRFRGLSAVSRDTAWVAGAKGTVLRTTDGGASWRNVSPPGAADLEFRDIEAFDARRAVVLAIGEGEALPGSSGPTTAARPGPSPSATPTRRPSTTV